MFRTRLTTVRNLVYGLVLAVSFFAGIAQAQVSTAALNGTVTDSTGAVVPEASLMLRNTQTGVETRQAHIEVLTEPFVVPVETLLDLREVNSPAIDLVAVVLLHLFVCCRQKCTIFRVGLVRFHGFPSGDVTHFRAARSLEQRDSVPIKASYNIFI